MSDEKKHQEKRNELLQKLGQLHCDQAEIHGKINQVYRELEALKKIDSHS